MKQIIRYYGYNGYSTVQLTIDVDASMKKAIMQVLKQIKGVVKVKDTTPKSNRSKEEYYKMLDLSIEQARNGQTTAMPDNETAEQFLNRLICTQ